MWQQSIFFSLWSSLKIWKVPTGFHETNIHSLLSECLTVILLLSWIGISQLVFIVWGSFSSLLQLSKSIFLSHTLALIRQFFYNLSFNLLLISNWGSKIFIFSKRYSVPTRLPGYFNNIQLYINSFLIYHEGI